MSRLHIFQKVANVIVYLFFLSATVYSVVGPAPSDTVIREGQTYITPCKSSLFLSLSFFLLYILTDKI